MKNTQNEDPRDRLIFALDVGGDLNEAVAWVDLLKDKVGLFKVGKESFTRFGPEIVYRIQEKGSRVFLDLKYHDIPNTVARAAEAAVKLNVAIFNVHALGGRSMIKKAVESVRQAHYGSGNKPPLILAVTVLTSMSNEDLKELGFAVSSDRLVLELSRIAQDAGASGVVASAQDIEQIRKACGRDFVILTPGIRGGLQIPDDDQKRVLSAEEAVRLGADYLVVGRPIAKARDPVAAADEFLQAIASGLQRE